MSAPAGDLGDGVFTPSPKAGWQRRAEAGRDLARLVVDLLRDPRVARRSKLLLAGSVGYAVLPARIVPGRRRKGRLPGVVDLTLLAVALRQLITEAGYEVVREHWQGSDAGFAWLLAISGVER